MNIGDPIFYIRNKYSKVNEDDYFYYITTNMRVIVENNRLDDLQYQVEPKSIMRYVLQRNLYVIEE